MFIDGEMRFTTTGVLNTGGATVGATTGFNVLDLSLARNIGVGTNIYFVFCVVAAITHSNDVTSMEIEIQADSTTTFTPDGRQRIKNIAAPLSTSVVLAAGTVITGRLAPDLLNFRYLQMVVTPAGANVDAGTVAAFLTADVNAWTAYADNVTIA